MTSKYCSAMPSLRTALETPRRVRGWVGAWGAYRNQMVLRDPWRFERPRRMRLGGSGTVKQAQ